MRMGGRWEGLGEVFRGFRILHSDLCCGLRVWKARSCFLEVS